MLPVGPTGYGNSPYSAQSAFAGNPALVSLDRLIDDGLLSRRRTAGKPRERAAAGGVRGASAHGGGARGLPSAFVARQRRPGWTTSRSTAPSSARTASAQWTRWPAPLPRPRAARALADARATLADDIALRALRAVALRARLARAARLRRTRAASA